MDLTGLSAVGEYRESFNTATGQNLPCGTIYQSDGLETHVRKRHPDGIKNLEYVEEIIASPDFIGKNPKEPNSVELVKILDNNVMVCIKLDTSKGYFFVASVYSISEGKLKNRLHSGRLKAI